MTSDHDFGKRYDIKQQYGIENRRRDGSVSTRHAHARGGSAEEFVANFLGVPVNRSLYIGGDGHIDLWFRGWKVDPKWSSWTGPETYLKVNIGEDLADIFVLVVGTSSFEILGWANRKRLRRETRDFGYGEKYVVLDKDLFSKESLLRIAPR